MLNFLMSYILVMSLFLVSSCGDLFMTKEKEVSLDQFATCSFDSEALAQILTKNIKGEIRCLKKNLLFFVDIVKSDAPGNLSERELKKYIRTHLREEVDEDTLKALGSVFDLSSIIFGDRKGYIKRRNVSSLFDLLEEINVLFVENNIHEYFTTNERISYLEHGRRKAIIFQTLLKVGNALDRRMVQNNNELNLDELIDYFQGIGDQELLDRVKSALFVKKAIIGGEEKTMSHRDLRRLADVLKDVSKIIYDFANIFDVDIDPADDEEVMNILKEDAETAAKNFYYRDQPDEQILTLEQLKKLLNVFAPKTSEYFKYEKQILKVKEIIFGDNSKIFRAKDLTYLFENLLVANFERGTVFYRAYRDNKDAIESAGPIEDDLNNITTIGQHQEVYKDDFNRILRSYRIFKGERKTPLFDFTYNRNARAMFEIALFEDLVNRVFKQYGQLQKGSDTHYTLNLEELNIALKDFEEMIVDIGWVYPGRISSTANTIALMTSLFHYQSNGDDRIEVTEMVEFIITMLTSLDLSSTLFENIAKYCPVDEKGKYETQCFRDNFRASLRDPKHNDKSLHSVAEAIPLLDKYLHSLSEYDYQLYMKRTAQFSRTCTYFDKDGTEVPMEKGDGLVTWAGLLAIEQSMIKYDADKNGILSPRELDNLYDTFRPALEAMIPVGFLKPYSRKFFKYIVKYKKIPDVSGIKGLKSLAQALKQGGHFVWNAFNPFKSMNANADRMTFAAVLQIIAENTPTEGEPFDCETLRN